MYMHPINYNICSENNYISLTRRGDQCLKILDLCLSDQVGRREEGGQTQFTYQLRSQCLKGHVGAQEGRTS